MLDLSRLSCLGEAFRDAAVTFKSNVALIEADRHRENVRFSYRELCAEAERVAGRLQQAGFAPGDRCAILMSNQSRWVITGLAVLWAGGVIVPLDYKLKPDEQLALLRHAKPKGLVTEYGIFRSFGEDGLAALESKLVLLTEAPKDAALGAACRWDENTNARFRYVARERTDLATIVYSSGTSGTPKGCMLTHDAYLEQAQALGRMYPMQESDLYFSILPTNHAIDFMCGMIVPFLFGAAVVHQRTLRPEFLAPTMKRYRVTHMALVPRILKTLRERIEEQLDALPEWKRTAAHGLMQLNEVATLRDAKPALSRALLWPVHERFGGKLRVIVAGGAFVDPELAEFFYKLGLPVAIGYGLTETCTVVTLNDLAPFRSDSVGRVVDGVDLRIREPNDEGIGEVCVRSRTVMQGYLDAPELTAAAFEDGYLRTGDLGKLDASGHLHLVGRAKNMIVTAGGKNVYPEDIEAAFDSVPAEELCVYAERFVWPKLGNQGEGLCVVLRVGGQQDVNVALSRIAECNQKLAEHKRVRSYLVVADEFPRTASQKVKREQLAKQIASAGLVATTLPRSTGT